MSLVLVVDDADDLRQLCCLILERAGHEVEHVPDGAAALARLRGPGPQPDLVLLDVQMPGINGWEVLERIRADAHLAPVRVVLCTVKAHDADIAKGWRLGCDAYIAKPFRIEALLDIVHAVLDRPDDERAAVRSRGARDADEMAGL